MDGIDNRCHRRFRRVGAVRWFAVAVQSVAAASSTAALLMVQQPVGATLGALHPETGAARAALVFDGVTVIDVAHGRRLRDQRVVVVGNRIIARGRRRTVRVPAGAQIVEARGRYLIPGLWNMHFHLMDFSSAMFRWMIVNGVTGMRDAGDRFPLDTFGLWKREIAARTRIGPRLLVSGQAISGSYPECVRDNTSHLTCVTGPEDARQYVDSLQAAGVDMIKVYALSPPVYFAIAAEARRLRLPFGGHVNPLSGLVASDSGALILDHEPYLEPNVCGSSGFYTDTSLAQCAAAAARLQRNHTWVTDMPYVDFKELPDSVWKLLTRYGQHGLPGSDSGWVPTSTVEWAAATGVGSANRVARDCAGTALRDAARLPTLANTDVGHPGRGVHMYLLAHALCGASPLSVLQTATLNPAMALRATDSLGTVEQGKLADLVLLDADPLADIWNVTKIRAVVANGRYFDRTALDRLEAEAQAEFDAAKARGSP